MLSTQSVECYPYAAPGATNIIQNRSTQAKKENYMKILHTADWHLGHRLHEQSQFEEQTLFLTWIENYITEEKIDVLLISGDIFDTNAPSNQSLEMYYNFLMKLKNIYLIEMFHLFTPQHLKFRENLMMVHLVLRPIELVGHYMDNGI